MSCMFSNAQSFNKDLSKWDVSTVMDMRRMLNNAQSFNQDVSNWDVLAVMDMRSMFNNAKSFSQDVSKWDGHAQYVQQYAVLQPQRVEVGRVSGHGHARNVQQCNKYFPLVKAPSGYVHPLGKFLFNTNARYDVGIPGHTRATRARARAECPRKCAVYARGMIGMFHNTQ